MEASPSVAVRSSATAEDLPDASFAGQQDTYLNVTRESLVKRVRECWASLFTERASYYRQEQGFGQTDVDIAVVVQRMVDAEKAGVMFTSDPSTGVPQAVIEAAWGLGEAVVSGAVTPDNYVVDRAETSVIEANVAEKTVMHRRDSDTGETVERPVSEEKRSQRVLSTEELEELVAIGEHVEAHYETPQDVEWAMVGDDVYVLQSRPITTIANQSKADADQPTTGETDGERRPPNHPATDRSRADSAPARGRRLAGPVS